MFSVLTEPQYGDGNIVETMLVGTRENPSVNVREVPLEALYPTVGPVGEDNHLLEEENKFVEHLKGNGMRKWELYLTSTIELNKIIFHLATYLRSS